MSTKIYNGYRIPHMSAWELSKWVDAVRQRIVKKLHAIALRDTARIAADIVDHIALGQKVGEDVRKHGFCPASAAAFMVQRGYTEAKECLERGRPFDYHTSLAIFPSIDGGSLVMLYTQVREFERIWKASPGVKFFGYWDNTDRPARVSAKEWERRRRSWQFCLEPDYIPANHGLSAQLTPAYLPLPRAADIVRRIPPKPERVKVYVEDILFRRQSAGKDNSEMFSRMREFRDYINSDIGKAEVAKVSAEVEAKLPNIDKAKLLEEFPKAAG